MRQSAGTRSWTRAALACVALAMFGEVARGATLEAPTAGFCEFYYFKYHVDNLWCASYAAQAACNTSQYCTWDGDCKPHDAGSALQKAALAKTNTENSTQTLWAKIASCEVLTDCAASGCEWGEVLKDDGSWDTSRDKCTADQAALYAATCDLNERKTSNSSTSSAMSTLSASATFNGITVDISSSTIDSLKSVYLNAAGAGSGTTATVTPTFKVAGSQTFASAVDETAFKAATATALSVTSADIRDFAQSSSRRRLLANTVTYTVSTTNMASANSMRAAANTPIVVGSQTATSASSSTSVTLALTFTVPTSSVSTVQTNTASSTFATTLSTAATTAGVANTGSTTTAAAPPSSPAGRIHTAIMSVLVAVIAGAILA